VLTRDEARAIARASLDERERPEVPLELIDESTIEGPEAFVFFWNSRAYIADQSDYRQMILGNVPIRVDRATGEIRMLSRHDSPEEEAGLARPSE
jgi:Immunity protein 35